MVDNVSLFESIIGPTLSDAQISALGTKEAQYISVRNTALNDHWAHFEDGRYSYGHVLIPPPVPADAFITVNVYDRAHLYYAKYKSSGYTDTVSRDRARAIASFYMTDYTSNFTDWAIEPWLSMPAGVALYYADTSAPEALNWLATESAKWRSAPWLQKIGSTSSSIYGYDGRTTGKGIMNLVYAYICGAPSINHPNWGAPTTPISQIDAIRQAVNQTIAGRNGDGIWRYPLGSGNMAKPWMIGIILDALRLYERVVEPDARIAGVIQGAAEYLYSGTSAALQAVTGRPGATFYYQPSHTWYYIEGSTPDENVTTLVTPPNPALEGLLVNAYAYVYSKTADPVWATRANDILQSFPGLTPYLNPNYFGGQKAVNESFSLSYQAFPLLAAAAVIPPKLPLTLALRCR